VAAEACGLEDTIGTLAEGKAADIIVVKGDPLNDVRAMTEASNITWVIMGGSVVRRPGD
jgi:imidazolonepropionase-like amidohydrolase